MTIKIKRYVEPLSIASKDQQAVIIESAAYEQVCRDLEMYVNGEILGRSFLVAGHRGAGKTTMLGQAVQEIESRIRKRGEGAAKWVRPLFVPLHGPDLLEKPAPPKSDQQGGQENGDKDAVAVGKRAPKTAGESEKKPDDAVVPPEPPPPEDLRHFLDRITSGLYVNAAKEFARCFREQAMRAAGNDRERSELLELAADLQVQLDRQPDLDRLRDYWDRVNALDDGVLFASTRDTGRGVAEVTALFSVGRVMRTVAGKLQSQWDTEANRKSEGLVSFVTIDGQNLLPPLIGLATGAAVWSTMPDGAPLMKAFSALLTGWGAVLALKATATRSRSTSQTWKETYIPKDDPGSLYRVLPGLIERFQRVGLFPVFVVDELDKVPGLGGKINSLLGYMKQFVTERAFFCFVTNRSFYQQANAQAAGSAYSTLHTRFGDSVFVRYRPLDFHNYLDRVISVDTTGMQPPEIAKAQNASAMLRYAVLSQSYLHPYDLRRELAQWQDGTGVVNRTEDELIESQRVQRDVAMQVAVEVIYNGAPLREYVRDPITAQTVLDALYYPTRKWREGMNEFDLTQDELTKYLVARTGIHEEVAAGEEAIGADKLVPPSVQKALLAEVARMMKLLCNPPLLADEATRCGVKLPDAVTKMLRTLEPLVEMTEG